MSFNSKAFLADRERLLEPDQQLRGSYRHSELRRPIVPVLKPYVRLTEEEDNRLQDIYLAKHNIK